MKNLYLSFFLVATILSCRNEKNETNKINIGTKSKKSSFSDSVIKLKDTIVLLKKGPKDINDNELIKLFQINKYDPEAFSIKKYNQYLNPKFSVNKKQFFRRGKENYILAVLGLWLEGGNHFDTGASYIGCFQLVDEKWELTNKPLKVEGRSMWGNCDDVKTIEKYGENLICASLEGGQGNQGFMETNIGYYGFNSQNEIKLIYSGLTSSSDGGAGGSTNDEYEYKFLIAKNLTYYQLEKIKKSNEKIVSKKLLKFNENTLKYE